METWSAGEGLAPEPRERKTDLPVPQTNAAWAAALTWRPKNGHAEGRAAETSAAAAAALFADTP